MTRIILYTLLLMISSVGLSQEIRIAATAIIPRSDGVTSLSVNLNQITPSARIDLAFIQVPLGDVEIPTPQMVELRDKFGNRLAVGFVGKTNVNNKGRQSIKCFVTDVIRVAMVNSLQNYDFYISPLTRSRDSLSLLKAVSGMELTVYATTTE